MHKKWIKKSMIELKNFIETRVWRREVVAGTLSKQDAILEAKRMLSHQTPDCDGAAIGGSFVTGQSGAYSDIDILVLNKASDAVVKERILRNGLPFEIITFGMRSLACAYDRCLKTADPYFVHLMAGAEPFLGDQASMSALIADASAIICQRAISLENMQVDPFLVPITSYVTDMARIADRPEAINMMFLCLEKVVFLLGLYHTGWRYGGRYAFWELHRHDPSLYHCLTCSVRQSVVDGNVGSFISCVDDIVGRFGGFLWQSPPSTFITVVDKGRAMRQNQDSPIHTIA